VQTDRRTRDRVRLFFWAVLTVVCLVAVLVARQQQEQGLQRKIDAAQERAVRFTQNVLADRLDAKRVSQPIGRSGYDELLTELKHGLFNDQRVVRVRVWRDDGLLVFTTDHPGEIGSIKADDVDVDLRPAMRGELTSSVVGESFARDDATTPEPTALLSTFVPLRSTDKSSVFGAVQIDNDYALMVDATDQPWKQVQIAFAILALICLVMAIVSLEPGSPLSVISIWSDLLPPRAIGESGFVISVKFALLVNVAFITPGEGDEIFSESIALLFSWYTWPLLREMMLTFPCRFLPLLLNLTFKPKLVFAPTSPA